MSQPSVSGSATRGKIAKLLRDERAYPYLLIAPSLILILLLMFVPLFSVFKISLENYSMNQLYGRGFIGLKNFQDILTNDPIFFRTIPVTIRWVVIEVVLQLVFGMIVALLLNRTFKGRAFARAAMFIPWAVSGVLTTMLWLLIFNQHIGLLNDLLRKLGLIHDSVAWLANPGTVFGSVLLAELWRGIPFFAITLLAALQTIPPEIYESGKVDGCGPVRQFFLITLPFLKEAIVFATLMRAIWEFNNIDMIFTMTGGGPVYLTTTLPIYMMQSAIIEGNYGYGSALAVIIFIILMIFTVTYLAMNKFGRSIDE
ncbi:carbohydrate ABC transporter membrane protein 1 (CUT1 family) [Hydrogenispora ethanolica]|uniref:Carbohydrate ABC transporter membrane protein 1 (CUT1 family) n=1 Tax=Hydrogenispora ethanolica TaxID=1082276 RepID=A0A4R1SC11_HYDET|nr:sugar ABC transporter permease [Hydrogenispora ethanolica]TCL76560.1 carbohydrate ABC transporter membrane protein 1 (CUT1 family) [Hydrogenispora ethanolica]